MRLLAVLILTVASLCLLVCGSSCAIKTYSLVRSSRHASGVIVSNKVIRQNSGGYTYQPTFSFIAPNGREVVIQLWYSSSTFDSFRRGDKIDVLFDPSDYYQAEINSWKTLWIGPIAISAVGALLSFVTWTTWKRLLAVESSGTETEQD